MGSWQDRVFREEVRRDYKGLKFSGRNWHKIGSPSLSCPRGICSRTSSGYQNSYIIKSHRRPSVSVDSINRPSCIKCAIPGWLNSQMRTERWLYILIKIHLWVYPCSSNPCCLRIDRTRYYILVSSLCSLVKFCVHSDQWKIFKLYLYNIIINKLYFLILCLHKSSWSQSAPYLHLFLYFLVEIFNAICSG